MPDTHIVETAAPRKFQDPETTAKGEPRASVALTGLRTLWINTGSLCNLTCVNCYIESSPTNDRLAYISTDEVRAFLDEIGRDDLPTEEIGFTGGEPFMNRDLTEILDETLRRGFRAIVLTNAMKPMHHRKAALLDLRQRHGARLRIRVSLDHHTADKHEALRGPRSWRPALDGLRWLAANGFAVDVAGRTCWDEAEDDLRAGYAALFTREGIAIDARDPAGLVLFPEMDPLHEVPEITTACWNILGVAPESMMCAASRMVIKRKGAARPVVVPCTLLPYDAQFEMGHTLRDASRAVKLNHPFCAQFCVLGGASCSAR
jgi:uncharacterized Fe-S cluster-containing radical SAM superfamily protein